MILEGSESNRGRFLSHRTRGTGRTCRPELSRGRRMGSGGLCKVKIAQSPSSGLRVPFPRGAGTSGRSVLPSKLPSIAPRERMSPGRGRRRSCGVTPLQNAPAGGVSSSSDIKTDPAHFERGPQGQALWIERFICGPRPFSGIPRDPSAGGSGILILPAARCGLRRCAPPAYA